MKFGVVWYSGMRKWYAGFFISVAAVRVVPGVETMQKCGYYPGIPGFFQVYPQNTRYFADFADFATKKALRLALISVRQLVSRTTF